MKTAICHIKGVAPYSASRHHAEPKLNKETADAYEERTWPLKSHVDADGIVFIPCMAFKQAIDAASKHESRPIPGKGKATYTKHFLRGVLCTENLSLGVKRDQLDHWRGLVNSDGVRGSGKRVFRTFPEARQWSGKLLVHVLDDVITQEVFEVVLRTAGAFIGVGRFRPENGGYYGRFEVTKIEWTEVA